MLRLDQAATVPAVARARETGTPASAIALQKIAPAGVVTAPVALPAAAALGPR
jgi:hypothetical protein